MGRGKGKGKRPKGTRVMMVKKKMPKNIKNEVLNDAFNPVGIEDVPPALRPMIASLRQAIEKRIRYAELKSVQQHQKTMSAIDEIKSNQIVLQTLLMESKLVNEKKFAQEYSNYMHNVVGLVKDGRMSGIVFIDTFNLGVKPESNSSDNIPNKSKNPLIINRS